MKKIISMLLVVSLCCGMIVGCGGKPSDVSQEVYDLGVRTCNELEDYVSGTMSQETCYYRLVTPAEEAEEINRKNEEELGDKYSWEERQEDKDILENIIDACDAVKSANEGETYEAEDILNELKEQLNLE
ncbi:hypothetical protein DWX08_10395 [Ruminococcus sp. AF18-22]|jgi:lipoprotein|nr:hypothetical protein [uncultured Blautia sp.]RGT72227.1 hypothetical protein DWX08_10395 [Ruminococcus sp. AF18-22]DAS83858.1 MAG TPA: protein of unknown function (DUF4969) [Caudoviricetes sp.]